MLFTLRVMLGCIWLYNGLWLKILHVSPQHLAVVQGLGWESVIAPALFLTVIGWSETLLALAIWSGRQYRLVSWLQFGVLLLMNLTGILFSSGIEEPMHLLVQNLPLFMCILIAARYGSGTFFLRPDTL
jgi:uncharacterized membrane protein YphA (DoxX/SURF4 family)